MSLKLGYKSESIACSLQNPGSNQDIIRIL